MIIIITLLQVIAYLRFFNQGLTLMLLFLIVVCFVVFLESIYSKQIEHLLMIVCEGFLFTCLHEFHEIQLYVMKYALNCVSLNSLKEIFHSVSSPYEKFLLKVVCWRIQKVSLTCTDALQISFYVKQPLFTIGRAARMPEYIVALIDYFLSNISK